MTPNLVSVVILNWNGAEHLPGCLAAVREQDYRPLEVIVADNASTDGSADQIEHDPTVRLIRNATNLGFAAGNNRAIRAAQGEFVLILNNDAVIAPSYVSVLVRVLASDPTIGSATGKLLRATVGPAGPIIDSTGHVMYRNIWSTNRGEEEPDGATFKEPGEVFGVCAAAALYRRAMLDDVLLEDEVFDSSFFAYLEDVDLDWRARLRGWRSWYEPTAVGVHARGGTGAWFSTRIQRHIFKNRILMIIKNDGGPGLLRRLPGMIAFTGAKLLQLTLMRPAALLGTVDAVRLIPQAVRKRRVIQARRTIPSDALETWFEPYPYRRKLRQGRFGRSRRQWISQS
ncbi:MAG: glycosyltransferase family 2 protein [Candidatus Dormibacter sp.]